METAKVAATQHFNAPLFSYFADSMILTEHPWVAKGPEYLRLPKEEKAAILMDKIMESDAIGARTPFDSLIFVDFDNVFDESGDQFDCRIKTAH